MFKKTMMFLVLLPLITFAEIKEQKFKVEFKITFNEMTLKQASEMEIKVKELFKDAYNININIQKNVIFNNDFDPLDNLIVIPDNLNTRKLK